ncbi:MAG TPA: hypothetical protein VEH76_14075 [Methylocystis sp.]|nr:hypothetical protein [Methylocystis sp.]
MGQLLGVILTVFGALASEVPRAEQRETLARFGRLASLHKEFTLKHDKRAALQTRLAITQLSWRMPARARRMAPPLFSARTAWQIDMSVALIQRELEE